MLPRNNPPKRAGGGSCEEFHPYGTTAWVSTAGVTVSLKRYKFTGMERDEETGLQCHGVRYYAPWLGRWTSADPIGLGDGVNRFRGLRDAPTLYVDPTGMLPPDGASTDRMVATALQVARDAVQKDLDKLSQSPIGPIAQTVVLGGAGFESETEMYAPVLARAFEDAGVPGPVVYVPISIDTPTPIEQPQNILVTLDWRSRPASDYEAHNFVLGALLDRVEGSLDPKSDSHNIVGYSYGSIVAAQAALRLTSDGTVIDNLVLIGSPIEPDSDLAAELESRPQIGHVIWVDIPGDPFSAGIHPSDLPAMWRHFVFVNDSATAHPTDDQVELADALAEGMLSPVDVTRLALPTSLETGK